MINSYADIGNTAVKILYNDKIYYLLNKEQIVNFFVNTGRDINKIYYSSVNKKNKTLFLDILTDYKINNYCINDDIQTTKTIDFSEINGIGYDRILGLFGGLNFVKPPFITVDCGTCTTINILSSKKKVLGGAILPGLETQLKSLYNVNPILSANINEISSISNGVNTSDAVLNGILSASAGGISYFIEKAIQNNKLPSDIPILIAGGWGKYIYPFIDSNELKLQAFDNLVVYGVKILTNELTII